MGIFFRLSRISYDSLSQDEYHALEIIKGNAFFNIDIHPPAYFMILSIWISVFGSSDFSIRIPSLLFELFSIILIYLIGENFVMKNSGKGAAAISLLSAFFIFHSSDAKPYSLYLFLSLLSSYLLLKIIRRKNFKDQLLYVLAGTVLIYTHYHGFFIILFHIAYALTYFIKTDEISRISEILPLQGFIFLSFMPFLMTFLSQARHIDAIDQYGPLYLQESLRDMLHDWTNFMPLWLSIILLAFCTYILFSNSGQTYQLPVIFLLEWLLLPLAASYIISLFFTNIFRISRFFIGIVPAFYLLISMSVLLIKNKKIRAVALLSMIIYFVIFNVYLLGIDFKTPWKEISADLSYNDTGNHTLLVLNYDFMKESFARYYSAGNLAFLLDYSDKEYRIDPVRWGKECDVSLIHKDKDFEKISFEKPLFYVYNDHVDYNLCNEQYLRLLKEAYSHAEIIKSYCIENQRLSGWYCNRINIYLFSNETPPISGGNSS